MVEIRKVAVMGATGVEGRGVVDALSFTIGSIQYDIRPMTRSLKGQLAQAFARDYPQLPLIEWEQGNIESLRLCFQGCYGVFLNLGAWTPGKDLKQWTRDQIEQGNRCIDAAKASGISHVIYPTHPSVFNATGGLVNIRLFEAQYQVQCLIRSSPIPSTILGRGASLKALHGPQYSHQEGDTIVLSTPAAPYKKMSWFDPSHDIGWFARSAFDKGPEWKKNEIVPVCGQNIPYAELASQITAVMGVKAKYQQCEVKEFAERVVDGEMSVRDMEALGHWLSIAPDDKICFGTIESGKLINVQQDLDLRALTWEEYLEKRR